MTGTRAEFGLLRTVMRAVDEHPQLTLRVVVAGMHLATGTWRDVRDAGFAIDAKVAMQRRGEHGRAADVRALGRGVAGFGGVFEELAPEVVVVLGDRIEAYAAATAAAVGGVRVAHLHGGDRAEGVADESMRHAITKLAHLHFPATAQSRRRIVRMGEDPRFVWRVGSPAVDELAGVKPAKEAVDLVVLQHPVGAEPAREQKWMAGTLAATRRYRRLVLAPNGDPGREGIAAAIEAAGIEAIDHLPRSGFLSLLAGARAVVGNSSAGLIEAAALGVPCVNIGPRQAGRERCASVVDCDYGQTNVAGALRAALGLDLSRTGHPYGKAGVGRRVAGVLAELDLAAVSRRKRNRY